MFLAMDYEQLDAALERVRGHWPTAAEPPTHALICGSGWSQVVEAFDRVDAIAYEDIPGLGRPTVKGHSGMLTIASLAGKSTLIFQGRRHFYEGEGWTPIAIPVYVAIKLGVKTMVLTNSAGGVRSGMRPGDLMAISDHVNFMHANPLLGAHNEVWGPRFPDQSTVYDPELRATMLAAAEGAGLEIESGVYWANSGPTYETPAEVLMARDLGADAVGMSTVPEAILASAAGLRVAGISCITNLAAGISEHALTHAEVTETTKLTMPRMTKLVAAFWEAM